MQAMSGAGSVEVDGEGLTVREIRVALKHVLNIGGDQEARLDGHRVSDDVVLPGDGTLEFVKLVGHKGVGQVWTADECCQQLGISYEQLNQFIEEGLRVMRLADGSVRVTETAVDQFIAGVGGGVGGDVIATIAASLKRIADHFDPPPPDIIGTDYIADRLGCTVVWVAKMASEGKIPKNCIVPGTGIGKPWKFYRSRIDHWILMR